MKWIPLISTASLIVLLFSAEAGSENRYPEYRISTSFPAGDGRIVIYSYHLDELLETTYRCGKKYDQKGIQEIVKIFRSRSDHKRHHIDIELIELLDHLEDYFRADCIELISGYRSPSLEKYLKESGFNAVESSTHVQGKAADIHIDEVTEEIIAQYVRSLKVGGVGHYPALDFVHVDTGDVRNWDLPDRQGRLLMAMRRGTFWQVTTDRDLHLPSEKIYYEIRNIARTQKLLQTKPILQLFRRGKWKALVPLNGPQHITLSSGDVWKGKWEPSTTDPFGKYRIVIPEPKGYPHLEARSNEFYRKRN